MFFFEYHSINSVCLFVVYVSSFNVFESISLYNYGSVRQISAPSFEKCIFKCQRWWCQTIDFLSVAEVKLDF